MFLFKTFKSLQETPYKFLNKKNESSEINAIIQLSFEEKVLLSTTDPLEKILCKIKLYYIFKKIHAFLKINITFILLILSYIIYYYNFMIIHACVKINITFILLIVSSDSI